MCVHIFSLKKHAWCVLGGMQRVDFQFFKNKNAPQRDSTLRRIFLLKKKGA
jgi:hypothetical protein